MSQRNDGELTFSLIVDFIVYPAVLALIFPLLPWVTIPVLVGAIIAFLLGRKSAKSKLKRFTILKWVIIVIAVAWGLIGTLFTPGQKYVLAGDPFSPMDAIYEKVDVHGLSEYSVSYISDPIRYYLFRVIAEHFNFDVTFLKSVTHNDMKYINVPITGATVASKCIFPDVKDRGEKYISLKANTYFYEIFEKWNFSFKAFHSVPVIVSRKNPENQLRWESVRFSDSNEIRAKTLKYIGALDQALACGGKNNIDCMMRWLMFSKTLAPSNLEIARVGVLQGIIARLIYSGSTGSYQSHQINLLALNQTPSNDPQNLFNSENGNLLIWTWNQIAFLSLRFPDVYYKLYYGVSGKTVEPPDLSGVEAMKAGLVAMFQGMGEGMSGWLSGDVTLSEVNQHMARLMKDIEELETEQSEATPEQDSTASSSEEETDGGFLKHTGVWVDGLPSGQFLSRAKSVIDCSDEDKRQFLLHAQSRLIQQQMQMILAKVPSWLDQSKKIVLDKLEEEFADHNEEEVAAVLELFSLIGRFVESKVDSEFSIGNYYSEYNSLLKVVESLAEDSEQLELRYLTLMNYFATLIVEYVDKALDVQDVEKIFETQEFKSDMIGLLRLVGINEDFIVHMINDPSAPYPLDKIGAPPSNAWWTESFAQWFFKGVFAIELRSLSEFWDPISMAQREEFFEHLELMPEFMLGQVFLCHKKDIQFHLDFSDCRNRILKNFVPPLDEVLIRKIASEYANAPELLGTITPIRMRF